MHIYPQECMKGWYQMRMKEKAKALQLERTEEKLIMIITSDFTKDYWTEHNKRMASGCTWNHSYSQLLTDIQLRFHCNEAMAIATVSFIVETGYYLEMMHVSLGHYAMQALDW